MVQVPFFRGFHLLWCSLLFVFPSERAVKWCVLAVP